MFMCMTTCEMGVDTFAGTVCCHSTSHLSKGSLLCCAYPQEMKIRHPGPLQPDDGRTERGA